MALVSKQEHKKIPIPHEPNEWMVIKPLVANDLKDLRWTQVANTNQRQVEIGTEVMARCVQEWSYDSPINEETIGDLDLVTFSWLADEIRKASGIADDGAKKEQNGNSLLGPTEVTSLVS